MDNLYRLRTLVSLLELILLSALLSIDAYGEGTQIGDFAGLVEIGGKTQRD